jgi:hypothetical protein
MHSAGALPLFISVSRDDPLAAEPDAGHDPLLQHRIDRLTTDIQSPRKRDLLQRRREQKRSWLTWLPYRLYGPQLKRFQAQNGWNPKRL